MKEFKTFIYWYYIKAFFFTISMKNCENVNMEGPQIGIQNFNFKLITSLYITVATRISRTYLLRVSIEINNLTVIKSENISTMNTNLRDNV